MRCTVGSPLGWTGLDVRLLGERWFCHGVVRLLKRPDIYILSCSRNMAMCCPDVPDVPMASMEESSPSSVLPGAVEGSRRALGLTPTQAGMVGLRCAPKRDAIRDTIGVQVVQADLPEQLRPIEARQRTRENLDSVTEYSRSKAWHRRLSFVTRSCWCCAASQPCHGRDEDHASPRRKSSFLALLNALQMSASGREKKGYAQVQVEDWTRKKDHFLSFEQSRFGQQRLRRSMAQSLPDRLTADQFVDEFGGSRTSLQSILLTVGLCSVAAGEATDGAGVVINHVIDDRHHIGWNRMAGPSGTCWPDALKQDERDELSLIRRTSGPHVLKS